MRQLETRWSIPRRRAAAITVALVVVAGTTPTRGADGEDTVVVAPRESGELLANPGMGWQTFHTFADADRNLAGLPSSSAYFRFYWSEIEPHEGEIDFARLDRLLARARKAAQKLAFRIMCAGTSRAEMYVPQWLRDQGCPGFEYKYRDTGPAHWVPDMDSHIFLDAHFQLIDALGARYDGHPDVDLLDIGTVGLWGEWHMSGTGVELPSLETRLEIIDAWCRAFPRTPKVMLIGDEHGMKHAIAAGCGWRADCLGDMGGFSKTWNHMEHMYRQQIERTDAGAAWQKGPVAFESCWDMRKWTDEGWPIRAIFDYALDLHVSYVNNKSAPIPAGGRKKSNASSRSSATASSSVASSTRAQSWRAARWCWRPGGRMSASPLRTATIVLAFRLWAKGEASAKTGRTILTATSIRGWLPGRRQIASEAKLPADLAPGTYELAIAVVAPATDTPVVRLAIDGRGDDGWYSLSQVEVSAE